MIKIGAKWNCNSNYGDNLLKAMYFMIGRDKIQVICENEHTLYFTYENYMYQLWDNGGEIGCKKVNNFEFHRHIPYTAWSRPINECTLALRIASDLKGEAIDYKYKVIDIDNYKMLNQLN